MNDLEELKVNFGDYATSIYGDLGVAFKLGFEPMYMKSDFQVVRQESIPSKGSIEYEDYKSEVLEYKRKIRKYRDEKPRIFADLLLHLSFDMKCNIRVNYSSQYKIAEEQSDFLLLWSLVEDLVYGSCGCRSNNQSIVKDVITSIVVPEAVQQSIYENQSVINESIEIEVLKSIDEVVEVLKSVDEIVEVLKCIDDVIVWSDVIIHDVVESTCLDAQVSHTSDVLELSCVEILSQTVIICENLIEKQSEIGESEIEECKIYEGGINESEFNVNGYILRLFNFIMFINKFYLILSVIVYCIFDPGGFLCL